ncbi:zinc cluster transcription factor [Salix suchowensis]|nr:zinc cluster transcription factor [Salix suchowensis]
MYHRHPTSREACKFILWPNGVIYAQLRRESNSVRESEPDNPDLQEEPPAEGVMMLGSECLPRLVFEKISSASPPSQGTDSVDVEELADELKQLHILPVARPMFESQLAAKLHLRDHWFGSVVLAICAIASRYSDDPRVIDEEEMDPWLSTGEKWFSEIPVVRQSFTLSEAPSLYELQFYSLAVFYYQGTANPQACWLMSGIGMRYAQEVGAHRRTSKVAFFADRLLCAYVGRPCTIHAEEYVAVLILLTIWLMDLALSYDVEYPVEVDDEYWTNPDPELAFKQPPGKLSSITAFNLLIKLSEILGIVMRLLYPTNKSKLWTGVPGTYTERKIVAELDSQLNKWLDSVPEPRKASYFQRGIMRDLLPTISPMETPERRP